MKRYSVEPKPVKNIEISDKHIPLRIAILIIAIVVGVGAIGYGVFSALTMPKGWRNIVVSTSDTNCGAEFTFSYDLGGDGNDPTAQYRVLTSVYSDACVSAYKLFNEAETFENVVNVKYINEHPNTRIKVDEKLYNALYTMAYGGRLLYLAPYYGYYSQMFFSNYDVEAGYFDPTTNAELKDLYERIFPFVSSATHVILQFYDGTNEIMLHVSDEYAAFAEQNDIDAFIGFGWTKNAFVADYLAETIISSGYTYGYIACKDGFFRGLGDRDYNLRLYTMKDKVVYIACSAQLKGKCASVQMRAFPLTSPDYNYYVFDSGRVVTPYIAADGTSKASCDCLVAYSENVGCGKLAVNIADSYIADAVDETALNALKNDRIYSVYQSAEIVSKNDPSLSLTDVIATGTLTVTVRDF